MGEEPQGKTDADVFTARAIVRGRVTSAATGRGLAGIKVRGSVAVIRNENCDESNAETTTDDDGRYGMEIPTLEQLPTDPDVQVLYVSWAEAPRHVPWSPSGKRPKPPAAGGTLTEDIVLQPAYAVRGRVVDEASRPVEGVEVIVYETSSRGCCNPGIVGDWPETGEDGRFLADGMPLDLPRERRQAAGFFHPDYVRRFIQRMVDLPRDADGVADLGDIVLQRGIALSGRVTDEAGRPVSGEEVLVIGEAPYAGDPGCARTPSKCKLITDDEGRYTVNGLPPLFYDVVVARSDDMTGSAVGVDLMTGSRDDVDIIVGGTGVLSGRVTKADGSPATDIEFPVWQHSVHVRKTIRTDENGRYRVGGLVPGVHTGIEGLTEMNWLGWFTPPDKNADITLPEEITVTGRLVDRDTGKPMSRPRKVLLSASKDFSFGSPEEFRSKDGRFGLQDAHAGTWYLCATAEGYVDASRQVELTPESADLGDVPMHKGIVLRGKVTTAEGRSVRGAEVFLDGGQSYWGRTVRTNRLGRYAFKKLPDGMYTLRVRADACAPAFLDEIALPIDAKKVTHDVTMGPGVCISGRVADAGRPVERQMVVLRRQDEREGWSRPVWIHDANTDTDGQFVFPHVAPGEYALCCGLEERAVTVGNADLRCDFAWPGNYVRKKNGEDD